LQRARHPLRPQGHWVDAAIAKTSSVASPSLLLVVLSTKCARVEAVGVLAGGLVAGRVSLQSESRPRTIQEEEKADRSTSAAWGPWPARGKRSAFRRIVSQFEGMFKGFPRGYPRGYPHGRALERISEPAAALAAARGAAEPAPIGPWAALRPTAPRQPNSEGEGEATGYVAVPHIDQMPASRRKPARLVPMSGELFVANLCHMLFAPSYSMVQLRGCLWPPCWEGAAGQPRGRAAPNAFRGRPPRVVPRRLRRFAKRREHDRIDRIAAVDAFLEVLDARPGVERVVAEPRQPFVYLGAQVAFER
jgi:hypothetical protein